MKKPHTVRTRTFQQGPTTPVLIVGQIVTPGGEIAAETKAHPLERRDVDARRQVEAAALEDARTLAGKLGLALAIVVALAASGCGSWAWDDVPGAVATPTGGDAQWRAEVVDAAAAWASALEPYGCAAPVIVGEGGHRVEVIPAALWTYGPNVGGASLPDQSIEIRSDTNRARVLRHELGHAIGLAHADPAFGPSVMLLGGGAPDILPRDAAAAACQLGCGPCADGVDPYDDEDTL